jgi:hypothetical protein
MDRGVNRNAVIEESVCYKLCTIIVDKLVIAQAMDVLPDGDTSKILGLTGTGGGLTNEDSATDDDDQLQTDFGLLYSALQTLFGQGRCSRTMLELALIHSETSYPEFVELWIRSLPPNERTVYSNKLCNSNKNTTFTSIPWDYHFYKHSLQAKRADYDGTDGRLMAMPTPPSPLGDHRHTIRGNSIRNAAYFFYEVLRTGVLFDTSNQDCYEIGMDCNIPLAADYIELVEPDILVTLGPVFGINKTDLVFGVRSDDVVVVNRDDDGDSDCVTAVSSESDGLAASASSSSSSSSNDACGGDRTMSSSERILRTWNILYHTDRLCKTELEDALLRGPASMRDLLERGATLVKMTHHPHHPMAKIVQGILQSNLVVQTKFVHLLSGDGNGDDYSDVTMHHQHEQPELLECDYCGQEIGRKEYCSQCMVAMYCNRDCQKKDWKRHKGLCKKYTQHTNYPPH